MFSQYKGLTEKAATLAAIAYPVAALPQAIKIFVEHDASGLSLVSWAGFALVELVFLAYGLTHNLKPIILTGILWMILYSFIILGIIIYG